MPIKHAAAKALRQAKKAYDRNRSVLRNIAELKRQIQKSVAAQEGEAAASALRSLGKAADKAAQRNILKLRAAARIKSRSAALVNALKKK